MVISFQVGVLAGNSDSGGFEVVSDKPVRACHHMSSVPVYVLVISCKNAKNSLCWVGRKRLKGSVARGAIQVPEKDMQ